MGLRLDFIFIFLLLLLTGCSAGDSFNWSLNLNDPSAQFTIDVTCIGLIKKGDVPMKSIKGKLCYPPSEIDYLGAKKVFWCHDVNTDELGNFHFSVSANLPMTLFIYTWGINLDEQAGKFMLQYDGKWYNSKLATARPNQDASFIKFINVMDEITDLGGGKVAGRKVQSPYRTNNPNDVGYILDVNLEFDLLVPTKKSFAGNEGLVIDFKTDPDIENVAGVEVIDSNRNTSLDGKNYVVDFNTSETESSKPK